MDTCVWLERRDNDSIIFHGQLRVVRAPRQWASGMFYAQCETYISSLNQSNLSFFPFLHNSHTLAVTHNSHTLAVTHNSHTLAVTHSFQTPTLTHNFSHTYMQLAYSHIYTQLSYAHTDTQLSYSHANLRKPSHHFARFATSSLASNILLQLCQERTQWRDRRHRFSERGARRLPWTGKNFPASNDNIPN